MRYPVDQPYIITTHYADPVPGSKFGKHLGTDFAVPIGTPVKACINSTITRMGWSDEVGNFVEATGDDGMYYRYLHLSQFVTNNGKVSEGTVIAKSGNTGSVSTGPHCHLDIRHPSAWDTSFSNYVDPEVYLKKGDIMSAVNDGDTINHYRALFDREPDQAELDKNRDKEWNNPDPKLRAPLYNDMLGRGQYLTDEVKRLQKLLDAQGTTPQELKPGLYKVD